MEPWLAAVCGAGGAIIPDVLKIINNRFGAPPDWLRTSHYWLGAGLLIPLGALVALFSGPERLIDAAALGYAAPAIAASLFGRKDGGPKEVDGHFPIGLTIKDTSKAPQMIRIPTFIRGIRAAWARR